MFGLSGSVFSLLATLVCALSMLLSLGVEAGSFFHSGAHASVQAPGSPGRSAPTDAHGGGAPAADAGDADESGRAA